MTNRIEKLRKLMKEKSLDSVLVVMPEDRRYFSGFTGTTGNVLVTMDKALFITDFRYTQQAEKQCEGYEIVKIGNDYTLLDVLKEKNLKKLGIEDEFMPVSLYLDIQKNLPQAELIPLGEALTVIRAIKEESEIELIKQAAKITDDAFTHFLSFVKVGRTEREVERELDRFMKEKGASGVSFEMIVASGVRSSMPHGVASDKVIEDGDLLTLDFGCIYQGYCSDMTRTVVMGKATAEQKKIYDIVLKANEAVIEQLKPGITGIEADAIARDIITQAGYGENFGHSLGHGVGLEIHELPNLSMKATRKIEPSTVITDEPGIYIPDFGGVRIEDLMVMREDGCEVLSHSPKHLIEIHN